ncbi:hypothetical protein D1872_288450 [compost metagenome]
MQTFHDDDVVGLQLYRFIGGAIVQGEVVHRRVSRLSVFQNGKMFDQQIIVKSEGMIVIGQSALLGREVGLVFVIIVLGDKRNFA